jgi:hypothetical protein
MRNISSDERIIASLLSSKPDPVESRHLARHERELQSPVIDSSLVLISERDKKVEVRVWGKESHL